MAFTADPEWTPLATSVEALEAIVHELRHRLRNAYAVSGAIAMASARESPAHHDFASALAQRFTTLSMLQTRQLDEPGNMSLPRLAAQLTNAFATSAGAVRLGELPEVDLDEQQGRLVALVLGELCANSIRHGAMAEGSDPVMVSGRQADGRLLLTWSEPLSATPVADAEADEAGWRLLARMARAQGGRFTCEEEDGKLLARLEMLAGA